MTAAIAILVGGLLGLIWLKARCRCPYCGATYATTAAVVRHVKRSHLS